MTDGIQCYDGDGILPVLINTIDVPQECIASFSISPDGDELALMLYYSLPSSHIGGKKIPTTIKIARHLMQLCDVRPKNTTNTLMLHGHAGLVICRKIDVQDIGAYHHARFGGSSRRFFIGFS